MPERALAKAGNAAWSAIDAVRLVEGVSALQRLRELTTLADQLEAVRSQAVQDALDAGETWASIGDATGLSKPGAHRRWAAQLRARRLL